MTQERTSYAMIAVVLIYMAGLAVAASATETEPVANSGRVPLPVIPIGEGDSCVEDIDFMRRNHMSLLMHQRDETVQEGIRSKQYSLKECLSCHAVLGPDATPVTAASPQHFCRSCHDYAAVKIDCFQCHASRPEPGTLPVDHLQRSTLAVSPATHRIE